MNTVDADFLNNKGRKEQSWVIRRFTQITQISNRTGVKRLFRPICAKQFCLLENRLGRFLLLVRRVTIFAEDPFDHHAQFCSDGFFCRPVNAHIFANGLEEFASNESEIFVAQCFDRAIVCFESIVEGDFLFGQAKLFAAISRFTMRFSTCSSSSVR